MNTKQVSFDSELRFDVDLSALSSFSGFLGSWVDRSAAPLQERGIVFDFAEGKMHVAKSTSQTGGPVGTFVLPFTPWEGHEFPEELRSVRLLAPLHKAISVVSWTNRSSGEGRGTFRITTDGKVYMIGANNSIQMESSWLEQTEGATLFSAYKGSLIHRLDEVYQDMFKTSTTPLQTSALSHTRTALTYPFSNILNRDLEVGKIDPSLTYMPTKNIPNKGKFRVLEYDQETDQVNETFSGIDETESPTTLISYSRMSLFFSPLGKGAFSSGHVIAAYDASVTFNFLSSVAALLKDLEKRVDDTYAVDLNTYHFPSDDDSGFSVLGVTARHPDDLDHTYTMILTIPSTSDAGGMAPPSTEDVASIVPDLDTDSGMYYVSVPYVELRDTLAFWDNLQKADGANIVTPLKPISISVDEGERKFELMMSSETAHNEAVFDVAGPVKFSLSQSLQVPFDPLMKVLNSNLFQGGKENPYITFIRREVDGAAELVLSRNGCVAIIAEFI